MTQICPECGQTVRKGFVVCPFCGVNMATGKAPFPFDEKAQQVSSGGALGCFVALMLFIGVGFVTAMYSVVRDAQYRHGVPPNEPWAAWAFPLLQALPLMVVVALYFALRRRHPRFARGLLYSLFVSAALELGALVICR